jgi:hypothetical protein
MEIVLMLVSFFTPSPAAKVATTQTVVTPVVSPRSCQGCKGSHSGDM